MRNGREALNIKLPPMNDSLSRLRFLLFWIKNRFALYVERYEERHVNIGDFTPTICNEDSAKRLLMS